MRIRRLLTFASLLAAVLVIGAGPASASAVSQPSYPAALAAFNPNGVLPGQWHLVRKTKVVYLNSGLLAGCHSAGLRWQRTDGTQLTVFWAACAKQEINLLSSTYAVTRGRIPAAWRNLSVLGPNVDLVTGADGGAWRYWLQGNLDLALLTTCPHQPNLACARLSAPAARHLAVRLPGRLVVTRTAAVVPPDSPLLGAIVLLLLLLVGADRVSKRAKLEKFHLAADGERLRSVDRAAAELRKVSRRRWWAKLFLIFGLLLLASDVLYIAQRGVDQGLVWVVIGLVLAAVGWAGLRRYRDPQLSRERYHWRGAVGGAFHPRRLLSAGHPRRLLSAGLTLLLGLLTLLIPVVVLTGWVLAGLASDTQDLSSILAGLVIVAVIACYFLDRAAQRLRARSLQEAMKRDPDRSILYLRNFGDDAQKILTSRFNRRGAWQRGTGWLNPIGNARFEEVLARALAHSGPVVAIGQPGGHFHELFSAIAPTLGAAKTTLPQDGWKNEVGRLAKNARAVVVSATPMEIREGFAAELTMLARDVPHGHVILVFGTGAKAALHHRVGAFLAAVGSYPLFQDLTTGWVNDGTLIMVHSPADGWGTWRGWGAQRRTAWTYTAAIGAAMAYAEEAWSRPAATLIPPPEAPASMGQDPERVVPPQPGPSGQRMAALPLTETVQSALRWAAAEASRRGQPVDTKTLLVALMDADQAGRWDRIWLHSRSRDAIAQAAFQDPLSPDRSWAGLLLTGACADALATAHSLSQRYRRASVEPGFVVLGLIADQSNAVAQVLGIYGPDRQVFLARLVQEDLIGATLAGLSLTPGRTAAGTDPAGTG